MNKCKFEHYSVCHHIKHRDKNIRCTDNIKQNCPYYKPIEEPTQS